MLYLTIEQRETLREALSSRAALLRGEIASNLRRSRRASCGTLARRIEEDGEAELSALDGLESEIDGPEVHQEMRQLRKVRDALARLRSPDYGTCADCEGDIAFARLKNDPFVTLCLQCQQRRDLAQFIPNEM
jgi:DnaK suppressor protein